MGSISILSTNKTVKIKNLGGVRIHTQGCWEGSKNATFVLRSPQSYCKSPLGLLQSLKNGLIVNAVARERVDQGGKISQLRRKQSFRLAQSKTKKRNRDKTLVTLNQKISVKKQGMSKKVSNLV